MDAIIDSVSVATTFKASLAEAGVIFMPFSEAVAEHPAGPAVPGHGGAALTQLLPPRSTRRCSPTVRSIHPGE
ncbi:MAG: hypothetical protein R2705_09110 [Ilumatobacteraceae bacterium]